MGTACPGDVRHKSHDTSTRWLLPWGGSLLLHLLLAIGVMLLLDRPREVVWVDLLATQPVKIRDRSVEPSPPIAAGMPVTAAARRAANRVASTGQAATDKPVTSRPMSAATPTTTTRNFEPAESAIHSRPDTPAPAAPSPTAAASANLALPASTAPGERYHREQFAYIRERVMQRLVYPPMARRQGWQGEVRVAFVIRADGGVEELRVVSSSGHLLLDSRALRAVESAAPFPHPPAPAAITLPVVFSLAASQP